MKAELQQKLFDKYPIIFGDRTKPMSETCMCWGLDCGDGWYHLIDNMCKELMHISEKYDITVVADQVKEKYGTLRFYNHIQLGNRWTYHPRWFIGFINGLIHRLAYKYFNWLQSPVWRFYNWTRTFEHRLDGKVFITEHRGNWIKHGRSMLAYEGVSNLIDDIVGKYEDFSGMVCEECGAPAQQKEKFGWYKTICDKCGETDGYKLSEKEE
jgi:hypothetical protein